MPTGTMPNTCMCLREARRAAGFQNFGQAGLATHRSQEVIGRHERGDVALQMADVIEYAEVYRSPEILMAFCGECQIRQELFGKSEQHVDSLPLTVLRVSNRLRKAADHANKLAEIMDDGKVDGGEISGFQETLDFLLDVNGVWRDLLTACMAEGIAYRSHGLQEETGTPRAAGTRGYTKKAAPAGTGTATATIKSAHHSKL